MGILAGKLDSFGIDFVSVSDLPVSVISDYLLYFPIKVAGKLAEIPMRLILCDHVLNSRHQAVLYNIDIAKRHLMLITLKALRVKGI